MDESDDRQVIPGHSRRLAFRELIPIAEFLIERGHPPLWETEWSGFDSSPDGMVCSLARKITPEEWDAVNERFLLPDTFVYWELPTRGLIRDEVNAVDIVGYDEVRMGDRVVPIEVWEERERQAGRL